MSDAFWCRGHGNIRALARNLDWESSALGRTECWPTSLQTVVDVVLSASSAMAVFWGAAHIALYNECYAELLGDAHPAGFGRPAFHLGRHWEAISPMLDHVETTREGCGARVYSDDASIAFDIDYSPVHDPHGDVLGVLAMVREVQRASARGSSSDLRTTHRLPTIVGARTDKK